LTQSEIQEEEMSVVKDFRFPVSVSVVEGRLTRASVPGKHDLAVATPPEFAGGIPGVWSPEDLLVASAASCYAVTLTAVAERADVPIRELVVTGAGHVTRRDDGRFGFVAVELDARFETDEGSIDAARRAAAKAKALCIVTTALDVPVRVGVEVRSPVVEGAVR
jgi:organic hydroperoxide reductase OsmC/OhrA